MGETPFFPGRVYRLGVMDLHAYVEVLLSDAPIPARLHALNVLKPVIYVMLRDPRLRLREKLPGPAEIYEYAQLQGVNLEPPPGYRRSEKRDLIGELLGSAWNNETLAWLFRQLKMQDEEKIFEYLDRCAALVSALFAKLRLLAGGLE